MYRQNADVLDLVMAEARGEVARDRADYAVFFRAAEACAAEAPGVFVGGAAAAAYAAGEAGPDFLLTLYSEDPEGAARALADAFFAAAPEGLGHYAVAAPVIRGVLWGVSVNARRLATVAALQVIRGVHAAALVAPVRVPPLFGGGGPPLRSFGPELLLLGVYATLCDPAAAGEWPAALAAEAAIRPRLRAAEAGGGGGGGAPPGATTTTPGALLFPSASGGGGGGDGDDAGAALTRALVDSSYLTDPVRLVVGAFALAALQGRPPPPRARLQVVSGHSPEVEARAVAAVAAAAGLAVEWGVNDPGLPTDLRLRRLTFYARRPGDATRGGAVLSVFNAAEYEVLGALRAVPVAQLLSGGGKAGGGRQRRRGRQAAAAAAPQQGRQAAARRGPPPLPPGVAVGSPFLLMRFALVEAWTLRVLVARGSLAHAAAVGLTRELLGGLAAAAALNAAAMAAAAAGRPERALQVVFPRRLLFGRRADAALALKRAAFAPQRGQRPPAAARPGGGQAYYPAAAAGRPEPPPLSLAARARQQGDAAGSDDEEGGDAYDSEWFPD